MSLVYNNESHYPNHSRVMLREQWGPHEVWVDKVHERGTSEHRRSREKGASLFNMILLERWNVERRTTFAVIRDKEPAFIESYWLSVERRCGYVPPVWHAASQTEHTNTKYADFESVGQLLAQHFYAKSAKSVFACSRVQH